MHPALMVQRNSKGKQWIEKLGACFFEDVDYALASDLEVYIHQVYDIRIQLFVSRESGIKHRKVTRPVGP
jgi:hypothetical protein